MKLKDIKTDGEYAVKIPDKNEYIWSVRGKTVRARVTSVLPNLREVHIKLIGTGDTVATVSQRAVLMPWADYEVEQAHAAALLEDRNRDWRIEYDRQQAEKRARFEERILPAFRRLTPSRRHFVNPPGDTAIDVAAVIEDTMLRGGSMSITLYEDDIAAIAARIRELEAIVQQNALTSADLPQAGWGAVTDPAEQTETEA